MNRLLIAAFLIAAPAFAQWPSTPPPKTETAPAANPPPQAPPPKYNATSSAPRGDDGTGFGFGFRAAWSQPFGGLTGTQDLRDVVGTQYPLWIEAGYHITRAFYAGAYFQWAPGILSRDKCLEGQACSSNTERAGVEVLFSTAPEAVINPWVGLGFGYEWFNNTVSGASRSFKGLEMLVPQIGVDWNMGKASAGVFASFSLFGKYSSFTADGVSNDINDSRTHNWLQLGLKFGFRL